MQGYWVLDGRTVKVYVAEGSPFPDGDSSQFTLEIIHVTEQSNKTARISAVAGWIDQWRELFPEGKKDSGEYYRGDRAECLKRMQEFIRQNTFTREQIMEATRQAVELQGRDGYRFLPMAHYFIDKKGSGSRLKMACEALQESPSTDFYDTV